MAIPIPMAPPTRSVLARGEPGVEDEEPEEREVARFEDIGVKSRGA
jgi:hypothetical protein